VDFERISRALQQSFDQGVPTMKRLSGLLYAFTAITIAINLATQPKLQLRFCISHPSPNYRYDCCSEVTHTMLLKDTHPKSLRQIENGKLSPHPQTSASSNSIFVVADQLNHGAQPLPDQGQAESNR